MISQRESPFQQSRAPGGHLYNNISFRIVLLHNISILTGIKHGHEGHPGTVHALICPAVRDGSVAVAGGLLEHAAPVRAIVVAREETDPEVGIKIAVRSHEGGAPDIQ